MASWLTRIVSIRRFAWGFKAAQPVGVGYRSQRATDRGDHFASLGEAGRVANTCIGRGCQPTEIPSRARGGESPKI